MVVLAGAGHRRLVRLDLVRDRLRDVRRCLCALIQLAHRLKEAVAHTRLVVHLVLPELSTHCGLGRRLERLVQKAPRLWAALLEQHCKDGF